VDDWLPATRETRNLTGSKRNRYATKETGVSDADKLFKSIGFNAVGLKRRMRRMRGWGGTVWLRRYRDRGKRVGGRIGSGRSSGQKNWAPALPALFGLHRVFRGRCSNWRL